MEAVIAIIRNLLKNPRTSLILGVILGLMLGLIVGWGLWPISYTSATPALLETTIQDDYMRMTIDSYRLLKTVNPQAATDLAEDRWDSLGAAAGPTFGRVQGNPGYLDAGSIQEFRQVIEARKGAPISVTAPVEQPSGLGNIVLYASIAVVVILLAAGGYYLFRLLRKSKAPETATAHSIEQSYSRQVQRTDFASLGVAAPITHVVIPYVYGDDYFDESNSIDSPGGEMLGEYGVGITDYFKPSNPKKVTALDVWLFDTKSIATDTKVVISKYAFENKQTVERLSSKGELILAESDREFTLETKTLILMVKIVEVAYGQGPQPDQSYFDRLILEMAVWSKADDADNPDAMSGAKN